MEIVSDGRYIGVVDYRYAIVSIDPELNDDVRGRIKVEYAVLKDLTELTERDVLSLLRTLPVIDSREEAKKALERNVIEI
jgi:hypothetical protein